MKKIIQAKGLGKRYVIRHGHQPDSLREVVRSITSLPARLLGQNPDLTTQEEFWSLKNLNFTINQGERIGIIGRNGAGKSTLLKILSQISPPTTGEVRLWGRVASLLEVGTGFHPELTARENIYLNGTILGMRRFEIGQKFDEIVEFSGVEQFLDTPVKRFSSGMSVRLAFSVAAHLQQEILIVDEVLAVGDADFQKKCINKMQDVARAGRTIIFVSHNMANITQLCTRTLLLHQGKLIADGPTEKVIETYLSSQELQQNVFDLSGSNIRRTSLPETAARWNRAVILNSQGKPANPLGFQENMSIQARLVVRKPVQRLHLEMRLSSIFGYVVFNSFQTDSDLPTELQPGVYVFTISPQASTLSPGHYTISLSATGPQVTDIVEDAAEFSIANVGLRSEALWGANKEGVIDQPVNWQLKKEA